MKILLINGSPKGQKSNSLKLAEAFVDGIGQREVKILTLAKMNIMPCKGCFCCWNKTPGQCVIADDMKSVIEDILWADLIVWSFPLYYFNVPGLLKNLIDRQLPMCLPFMAENHGKGSGSHEARYDMDDKKHVLLSTCGFYSAENNYDSVTKMFDHFVGEGKYEKIFCGQGELFRVPELRERTDKYLSLVKKAGREYQSGQISDKTRTDLEELLYPKETFERMADSSWGIDKDSGEKADETLVFTTQMAALFNKDNYDGKNRVLEICYTDLGKTYQIQLTSSGSRVVKENSLVATTKIDTPWEVWTRIARGEIRGDAALAEGLYKVTGDFSLMINWDKFFGSSVATEEEEKHIVNKKLQKPTMLTMLAAWISLWVAVSIEPVAGSVIVLAVCACMPLIMNKRLLTVYDKISFAAVAALCCLAFFIQNSVVPVTLGYLCFGLMWLLSCFAKEPLCAAYVKYNYNGDDALQNPIFMKTNRILAAAWGILYILIAIWSWLLLCAGHCGIMQIINNSATLAMGAFTGWFVHWYPKHVAAGK